MDIPRCRERRGLSLGGGGCRRDVTVWSKKLVGEFAGTQAADEELREGWRELRATARDKGCTSETRASRATPAYI
jgi:hypothetical protein